MIEKLVVLGGELAVPFTRNPLYAGLNPFPRIRSRSGRTIRSAAAQQTVMNLVRSGRKQR